MSPTTDEIRNRSFGVTLRRGYERAEVDDFLAELADELEIFIAQAGTHPRPEITHILEVARDGAAHIEAEATASARRTRRRATERAKQIREKAQAEAQEEIAAGRRSAEEIIAVARAEAQQLEDRAQLRFTELLNEAEAGHRPIDRERRLRAQVDEVEAALKALRVALDESGTQANVIDLQEGERRELG
jgi:DivIVA domain-containing protein